MFKLSESPAPAINEQTNLNATGVPVLTKSSTESEIKTYFKKVFELKQSGKEFPVDLEMVWPMVYSEKGKAVRALRENFIENEDFITVAQNGNGGKFSPIDYCLSVSCMEYFIARKVRPVFEVYRQVFHKVADDTPELLMARALQVAQVTIENHRQRVQMLEGEKELLEKENKALAPKAEYTDKVLQSTSTYTMTQVAKELGMSAIALEKNLHDAGVMFKQSGQWILYAKYQDKGYTKHRTHHYTHSDGTTGTNTITVWTEKGRAFIHHVMKGGLL